MTAIIQIINNLLGLVREILTRRSSNVATQRREAVRRAKAREEAEDAVSDAIATGNVDEIRKKASE